MATSRDLRTSRARPRWRGPPGRLAHRDAVGAPLPDRLGVVDRGRGGRRHRPSGAGRRARSPVVTALRGCPVGVLAVPPAGPADWSALRVTARFTPVRAAGGDGGDGRRRYRRAARRHLRRGGRRPVDLADYDAAAPDPLRHSAAGIVDHLASAHRGDLVACVRAQGHDALTVVPASGRPLRADPRLPRRRRGPEPPAGLPGRAADGRRVARRRLGPPAALRVRRAPRLTLASAGSGHRCRVVADARRTAPQARLPGDSQPASRRGLLTSENHDENHYQNLARGRLPPRRRRRRRPPRRVLGSPASGSATSGGSSARCGSSRRPTSTATSSRPSAGRPSRSPPSSPTPTRTRTSSRRTPPTRSRSRRPSCSSRTAAATTTSWRRCARPPARRRPSSTSSSCRGRPAPSGGELNEHVWYDVPTVERLTSRLVQLLSAARPAQAATFQRNAAAFETQLQALRSRETTIARTATGKGVAITEPVPLYLLQACGLDNRTPVAFSEAVEEGSDVPARVLQQTLSLFPAHEVALLAYNEQTEDAATTAVVQPRRPRASRSSASPRRCRRGGRTCRG